MPELRYSASYGQKFDFYIDEYEQLYCVVQRGTEIIVENIEGIIKISKISEFFKEVDKVKDIRKFINGDKKLVDFVNSKLEELSVFGFWKRETF